MSKIIQQRGGNRCLDLVNLSVRPVLNHQNKDRAEGSVISFAICIGSKCEFVSMRKREQFGHNANFSLFIQDFNRETASKCRTLRALNQAT